MTTIRRELTPELKSKLAGLLPVSKKHGLAFKPDIYGKDLKEFAPTIYVRGWTVDEQKGFISELKKAEEDGNYNEVMTKYSYIGLVSIENLIDLSSGEEMEIPVQNGKVDKEFYNSLPISLISAVFQQVQKVSGIAVSTNKDDVSEDESLG